MTETVHPKTENPTSKITAENQETEGSGSKKGGTKKGKKKWLILFAAVVIVAVAAFFFLRGGPKTEYNEEIAKQRDIITYYSFDGNIEAADTQKVLSTTNMPIKTFYIKEGDMVKEGQPLFALDAAVLSSSLDQAKAALEIAKINYESAVGVNRDQQIQQAESNYATAKLSYDNAQTALTRMQTLFEEGAIAQVDLEQAQTGYDNASLMLQSATSNLTLLKQNLAQTERIAKEQVAQAKAQTASLQKQLDDTNVKAEVSGEVVKIHVDENAALIMGTPIMDIVDYTNLQVEVKVDEYDLDSVTEGTPANVSISAVGKTVNGTVTEVAQEAVVTDGISYYPTTITLDPSDFLRIGMSVEVKIPNQNITGVTTISLKALQFDSASSPFVYYRDAAGKVQEKDVTVGINDGKIVEIKTGIEPGETVLLPIKEIYGMPVDMMMVQQ